GPGPFDEAQEGREPIPLGQEGGIDSLLKFLRRRLLTTGQAIVVGGQLVGQPIVQGLSRITAHGITFRAARPNRSKPRGKRGRGSPDGAGSSTALIRRTSWTRRLRPVIGSRDHHRVRSRPP